MKQTKKPRRKLVRTLYFHKCKARGYPIIKDNKEPCQFCGTKKWRVYLKIYNTGEEKKASLLERILRR